MSMVLAYAGVSRLFPVVFQSGMSTFFDIVIIYQMIPVFPFDGMDGARVLNYSKTLYRTGVVASVLTLVWFRGATGLAGRMRFAAVVSLLLGILATPVFGDEYRAAPIRS